MNTNNPRKIKRKNNKKRGQTRIIILSVILVVVIVPVLVITLASAPFLASFLGFNKPTNNNEDEPVFDTSGLIEQTEPADEQTDSETTSPVNPEPDDTEEMFNFLVLGKDKVALNTDVIMIVNLNVTSGKIAVMQIPRDTYVSIDNYGYKLNSVYGHFYNEGNSKNVKDPEDYGLTKLSELLEQNLCLNIHYYAMVNLEGFRNIVDILGGVEVDIPADMYYVDEDQDLTINLKKGKQVLNGKKAEMFVRFRSGYVQADIGRMDAQKIFMSALLKEVKDHFNVTTVVKMAKQVFQNVKTDLSLNDMGYFAKVLLDIDLNNMSFMSISGYSPAPPAGYVWYYVINRQGTMNLINEHFNIYDFEITDAIFDQDRIFTSTTSASYLNPYYIADPETVIGGDVNSAEDINHGSITIPRT